MEEKNMQEFDRIMRSMLEDAEVRPSRRVWKNVSARVFDSPAPAPWRRWWIWTAPLVAAAAVAVFFLPSGILHREEIPTSLAEVVVPDECHCEVEQSSEVAPPAIVDNVPSETFRQKRAPMTLAEVVVPDECHCEVEQSSEVVPPAIVDNVPSEVSRCEENSTPREMTLSEFIAQEELAIASRPVELSIHGLISANESEFNMPVRTEFLAPGSSSAPTTGIKEIGDSTYGLPFTLGLGVRFHIVPRLSLATGLDYTMLTRRFEGKYTKVAESGAVEEQATGSISHNMHYLGIPLNLYGEILNSRRLSLYVYAGGEAEFCVGNNYVIRAGQTYNYSESVNRPQWSVGAGFGVQFSLTSRLGIYLDPGLRYYFNCGQPRSIRTDQPVMINMNAGLRFSL